MTTWQCQLGRSIAPDLHLLKEVRYAKHVQTAAKFKLPLQPHFRVPLDDGVDCNKQNML